MNKGNSSGNGTAQKRFLLTVILMTAVLCAGPVLRTAFLLFHTTGIFYWKVFYQRGLPLVIGGVVLCLGILAVILIRSRASIQKTLREDRKKWFLTGGLLLAGLAAGFLIWKTRLGLEKENAFWGKPTVPLLEWHLALAFLVCLVWFCLEHFTPGGIPDRLKGWLPLVIWLCAVLTWTAIPNQNGFFSPPGRAPNFETYPFSDGSFYGHYARAAAAGMGFKGNEIPPRPLYIAFLTGLHLLSGNQYDRIIFFQTLVLGLLPVFVYLCGRDLHSVEAGITAGLLVILRETHAILVAPFGHNVSTTKYFFADLPTALVCAAAIWLMIRWQKSAAAGNGSRWAFAAGCALGAMVLIRTQSFFLILLLPFTAIPAFRNSPKQGIRQVLLFLTALICCIAPWLLRSHRITGQFVFDHPMTQTAEMARSYNFDGEDLSQRPGENDGDYTNRMTAFIASAAKKHFPIIARFTAAHFLNSEISNFRLLPLRDRLNEPGELLKSKEPFWELLDSGELQLYDLIFFGLGYLLWAMGISASHQRSSHAGSIPLAAIILFNFSTALGRYSAGRYLIPTDWIMMLYFAVGMADFLSILSRFAGCNGSLQTGQRDTPPSYFCTALCILLIAAAIPLADRGIRQTFIQDPPSEVEKKIGDMTMECDPDKAFYLHAIAIYPRYYAPGEGEPESAKQGYGVSDYGRLVFLTLAPGSFGTMEMPLETAPEYLPDGAEVWFSGCLSGATSIVDTLMVERDGEAIRYQSK
ncbi:MAG: hypothetical protein IJI14_12545 [Anaerolineaceae bacterium]|nr:hypothetical protein [Anaerolineaceae bacterium]